MEALVLTCVRQAQGSELSPALALHTHRRGMACKPDCLGVLDAIRFPCCAGPALTHTLAPIVAVHTQTVRPGAAGRRR